jgi:hypothetical protein
MKTRDLYGPALDWAVWNCTGGAAAYPKTASGKTFLKLWKGNSTKHIHPSTDWNQGGPIIDWMMMEGVTFSVSVDGWVTARFCTENKTYTGDTLLIAAMRCCVAYKLGDEVEIPEELL